MDLLDTLALAKDLGVALALKGTQLVASPKKNVTDELRDAIKENVDDLKEHTRLKETEELYDVLTTVAISGAGLRLKDDALLVVSPSRLDGETHERLGKYRDQIVAMLKIRDRDERVVNEGEVYIHARNRWDTKPFEPAPDKATFGASAERVAFFKEGR